MRLSYTWRTQVKVVSHSELAVLGGNRRSGSGAARFLKEFGGGFWCVSAAIQRRSQAHHIVMIKVS